MATDADFKRDLINLFPIVPEEEVAAVFPKLELLLKEMMRFDAKELDGLSNGNKSSFESAFSELSAIVSTNNYTRPRSLTVCVPLMARLCEHHADFLDWIMGVLNNATIRPPLINRMLRGFFGFLWSGSDVSMMFCDKLRDMGAIERLLALVVELPSEWPNGSIYRTFLEPCWGILHNILKVSGEKSWEIFKDSKGFEIGRKILNADESINRNRDTCLTVGITMAYAFSEDEDDAATILLSPPTLREVLRLLECAQKHPKRRYAGYSAEELIQGINALAKSGRNREVLVNGGAFDLLFKSVESCPISDDSDETMYALKGLGTLKLSHGESLQFFKNRPLGPLMKKFEEHAVDPTVKNPLDLLQRYSSAAEFCHKAGKRLRDSQTRLKALETELSELETARIRSEDNAVLIIGLPEPELGFEAKKEMPRIPQKRQRRPKSPSEVATLLEILSACGAEVEPEMINSFVVETVRIGTDSPRVLKVRLDGALRKLLLLSSHRLRESQKFRNVFIRPSLSSKKRADLKEATAAQPDAIFAYRKGKIVKVKERRATVAQ